MWGSFRLVYQYFTYWRQSRRLERTLRKRLEGEVAATRSLLERANEQYQSLQEMHRLTRAAVSEASIADVLAAGRQASTTLAAHHRSTSAVPKAEPPLSSITFGDSLVLQAAKKMSETLGQELGQVRRESGVEGLRLYLVKRIRETGIPPERVSQLINQVANDIETKGHGRPLTSEQRARLLAEITGETSDTGRTSPKT
ncbi:hypothetical protein F1559_000617 [Cyanidiococcus yangmingshanensis]|uniref:Uncharacterized protein n=1 Tax=Cyanidiococcus yangmingshanensis TaxID=2690220 RepID=A0A7J7INN0_9RHOD|nr:hypothetical protein F1559_000617 [Cyanidiococcus yangmingshanensis]